MYVSTFGDLGELDRPTPVAEAQMRCASTFNETGTL